MRAFLVLRLFCFLLGAIIILLGHAWAEGKAKLATRRHSLDRLHASMTKRNHRKKAMHGTHHRVNIHIWTVRPDHFLYTPGAPIQPELPRNRKRLLPQLVGDFTSRCRGWKRGLAERKGTRVRGGGCSVCGVGDTDYGNMHGREDVGANCSGNDGMSSVDVSTNGVAECMVTMRTQFSHRRRGG
jgi:hypothetical protein